MNAGTGRAIPHENRFGMWLDEELRRRKGTVTLTWLAGAIGVKQEYLSALRYRRILKSQRKLRHLVLAIAQQLNIPEETALEAVGLPREEEFSSDFQDRVLREERPERQTGARIRDDTLHTQLFYQLRQWRHQAKGGNAPLYDAAFMDRVLALARAVRANGSTDLHQVWDRIFNASSQDNAEALELIATGAPSLEHLPDTLDFFALEYDLTLLWQQTNGDPTHRRFGACLLYDEKGIRLDHKVAGDEHSIAPRHPAHYGRGHIGFVRTSWGHSDGAESFGFSDADFIGAVEDGSRLEIVRSETQVFALVLPVKDSADPEDRERPRLDEAAAVKVFADCYNDDSLSLVEARRVANLLLCQRYGFALYRGDIGEPLEKLDTAHDLQQKRSRSK